MPRQTEKSIKKQKETNNLSRQNAPQNAEAKPEILARVEEKRKTNGLS